MDNVGEADARDAANRDLLTVRLSLPVYPDKQKISARVSASH